MIPDLRTNSSNMGVRHAEGNRRAKQALRFIKGTKMRIRLRLKNEEEVRGATDALTGHPLGGRITPVIACDDELPMRIKRRIER